MENKLRILVQDERWISSSVVIGVEGYLRAIGSDVYRPDPSWVTGGLRPNREGQMHILCSHRASTYASPRTRLYLHGGAVPRRSEQTIRRQRINCKVAVDVGGFCLPNQGGREADLRLQHSSCASWHPAVAARPILSLRVLGYHL
jgi:hypothetical protein